MFFAVGARSFRSYMNAPLSFWPVLASFGDHDLLSRLLVSECLWFNACFKKNANVLQCRHAGYVPISDFCCYYVYNNCLSDFWNAVCDILCIFWLVSVVHMHKATIFSFLDEIRRRYGILAFLMCHSQPFPVASWPDAICDPTGLDITFGHHFVCAGPVSQLVHSVSSIHRQHHLQILHLQHGSLLHWCHVSTLSCLWVVLERVGAVTSTVQYLCPSLLAAVCALGDIWITCASCTGDGHHLCSRTVTVICP